MKRFNYFVMSLISAAAFTFTACSSSDDLGGSGTGESKVEGFYMNLTVQTPTSTGTRTAEQDDPNNLAATLLESKVTSGTFFLVDANNKIVFSKTISATGDNSDLLPSDGKNGSTTMRIKVENVVAGATYKAYFLANANEVSWTEGKTFAPFTPLLEAKEKFAQPAATDDAFIMFNQNDETTDGNGYTVKFTDDNKEEATPASVQYGGKDASIKIERVTARIDEPTSTSAIASYDESKYGTATDGLKRAMEDAVKKVDNIKLIRYALADVANKSYIMQNWTGKQPSVLTIPNEITPWQKHDDFGTKFQFNNSDFFNAVKTDEKADGRKDYVFENNSETAPTAIYFEYKVTLKADAGEHQDFADGTFYRYNNIIYTSFEDIFKQYNDVVGLFSNKQATELATELKDYKADPTTLEANLAKFRETYGIEVFNEGKTYYKQVIKDNYIGYANAIQRNTVYKLNVSNIFNVGAQVPNGIIDEDALFYLSVNVTVNKWVLNAYDVVLK